MNDTSLAGNVVQKKKHRYTYFMSLRELERVRRKTFGWAGWSRLKLRYVEVFDSGLESLSLRNMDRILLQEHKKMYNDSVAVSILPPPIDLQGGMNFNFSITFGQSSVVF